VTGSELARGLLLRLDAVAGHFPAFKEGLPSRLQNTIDVRTYQPMTEMEGRRVAEEMAKETGSDFFSPVHTEHGYRFLNVPDVSGVSNKDFKAAVERMVRVPILIVSISIWSRVTATRSTTRQTGARTMVKIISRRAGPDDPMYKEGYRSYSPHWAREFRPSKKTSPSGTAGPQTGRPGSGSATPPTKPTTSRPSK
jgi:hypothetical protein